MLRRPSHAALAGGALVVSCLAAGSARAQSAPSTAPAPMALAPAVLSLKTNDLAFDPTRQLLYASVPSTVAQYGNTIVTIDPQAAKITASIAVGSEPGPLAISGDGHYLYVGLNGANAVRPVDLTTGTAGQVFSVGSSPASQLLVLAGQPTAVAVSVGGALTIYDNGVARSQVTGYASTINAITAGSSASVLYGYDNTDTGFDLSTIAVGSTGVTATGSYGCLISGFGVTIRADGSRVYGDSGQVVDVSGSTPVMAGTFALQSSWGSVVAPAASSNGCVFFAEANPQGSGGDVLVEAFDAGAYTRLFSIDVQGSQGTPASIAYLGAPTGGLAFRTDQGQVVLIANALCVPQTNPLPTPTAGPVGSGTSLLALTTNALAYDASRGVVYASVPSSASAYGNSIVTLDPSTGHVLGALAVGSEPTTLALSGDAHYLYVGLGGAAAVRQVDLTTMTAGLQFSLGADNFLGPYYAGEMAVLPGQPTSVAVVQLCLGVSPAAQLLTIFDNGVPRAATLGFSHSGDLIDAIGFGSSASVLYAYNSEDTGFDFFTLGVGASGVTRTSDQGNLIGGFGVDIKVQGSFVYATSGQVVDVSGSTPRLAGTFALSGQAGGWISVAPDASLGRVFFADQSPSTGDVQIEAFDPQTYTSAGAQDLTGIQGNPADLLSLGGGRFALRTDQGQVVFVSSSPVARGAVSSPAPPTPPAPPAPAPTNPSPVATPPTIYGTPLNPVPSPPPPTAPPSSAPSSSGPSAPPGAFTTPSSVTSGPAGPASPSSPTATLVTPLVIQLATNDLCSDPTRGLLYASVPSTAGQYGNTVVSIDPTTATVVGSIAVGSEPSRLAISDDGSTLYVSLVGAASVRAIDLGQGTAGAPFTVGSDPSFGPFVAGDLAVLPGQPTAVAVVRLLPGMSPSTNGVAIYDQGVVRPTALSSTDWVDSISFGSSAATLYGYDSESSGFELFTLSVATTGVSIARTDPGFVSGYGVDIHFDSGRIYASSGQAVDVTGASPVLAGTFTLAGGAFARAIASDVAGTGRVYFAEDGGTITGSSGSDVLIEAFDPRTFTRVAFYDVAGAPGDPGRLVRWGAHGLAFHNDSNELVILADSTLVPGTATTPAAPTTPPPSAPATPRAPPTTSTPGVPSAPTTPSAPATRGPSTGSSAPTIALPASTAASTPASMAAAPASSGGGGGSGGCEVARTQGSPGSLGPLGAALGFLVLVRRRRRAGQFEEGLERGESEA